MGGLHSSSFLRPHSFTGLGTMSAQFSTTQRGLGMEVPYDLRAGTQAMAYHSC